MTQITRRQLLTSAAAAVIAGTFGPVRAADFVTDANLEPLGLQISWMSQAVLNTTRDDIRHVVNDEDLVFAQSSAGVVTCFNAENGRKRWAAQVGRNDEHAMPAITNNNLVLIVAGPVVYGMNKFTGDLTFEHRLPAQPSAGPVADDSAFYVPMTEGSLYGFSIQTLQHKQRYGTLPPGVARSFLWRFVCREDIVYPPVIGDKAIAFVSNAKNLHSLNGSGRSLFQFLLNGVGSAPLTVIEDSVGVDAAPDSAALGTGGNSTILMATDDNRLYSVNLTRGDMKWNYSFSRSVKQKPVVVDDNVYVIVDGQGVICLSLATGRPIKVDPPNGLYGNWSVLGITSVVAVGEKNVYGIDLTNRLVVMDRPTGAVRGRISVDQYKLRHSNHLTDRLYLASQDGVVLCLKELGSDFANYHRNPDRQPIDANVPVVDPVPEADDGTE